MKTDQHLNRLIILSNVLTEMKMVDKFESALVSISRDSGAGTVILMIGGRGAQYKAIGDRVRMLFEAEEYWSLNLETALDVNDCVEEMTMIREASRIIHDHLICLAPPSSGVPFTRVKDYASSTGSRVRTSRMLAFRRHGRYVR